MFFEGASRVLNTCQLVELFWFCWFGLLSLTSTKTNRKCSKGLQTGFFESEALAPEEPPVPEPVPEPLPLEDAGPDVGLMVAVGVVKSLVPRLQLLRVSNCEPTHTVL